MQIFEVHNALASRIGDTVEATNTSVPDGVRYSKSLRDSYLYESMLTIYKDLFKSLMAQPKASREFVLAKLFPNVTRETILTLGGVTNYGSHEVSITATTYLYIIKARLEMTVNNVLRQFPLPIRTVEEAAMKINDYVVSRPSPFAVWFGGQLHVYNYFSTSIANATVKVYGIDLPIHPSTQSPTDDLDIEEVYLPTVLSYSVLKAMQDDQQVGAEMAQILRSE